MGVGSEDDRTAVLAGCRERCSSADRGCRRAEHWGHRRAPHPGGAGTGLGGAADAAHGRTAPSRRRRT
ncbi:hypothetical protein PH213_35260, partial [Streptomyces sp. SRF1]|nr:hypothetical protein [Streptomyces sp. SRF1]